MVTLKDFVSNSIVSVYTIAFIGLALVATWDVADILNDYIYDNKFSLVKLETLSSDYPFLNFTDVCFQYNGMSSDPMKLFWVFPGSWLDWFPALNSSMKKFKYYENNGEITVPLSDNETEHMTQGEIAALIFFYNLVTQVDTAGIVDGELYSEFERNNEANMALFDEFISNPQSIQMVKWAWTQVQKIFIAHPGDGDHPMIPLKNITYSGHPCVSVPLHKEINESHQSIYYGIDIMPWPEIVGGRGSSRRAFLEHQNDSEIVRDITDLELDINFFNRAPIMYMDIDKIGPTKMQISISNVGVFDKSEFEPQCTRQYATQDECIENVWMNSMVEVCHCIPYSWALKQMFLTDEIKNYSLPFCNSAMNGTCFEKAQIEYQRRKNKAEMDGSCKPCQEYKNIYITTISNTGEDISFIHSWPRVYLEFDCRDISYLLYEQRYQIRLSQLISQIGGDLGLYIGFSMLSFLQLILFLYNMQREKKNAKTAADKKSRGWKDWVQYCKQYIFNSYIQAIYLEGAMVMDPAADKNKDSESVPPDLQGRLSNLENWKENQDKNMQNQMKMLNEKMERLEDKLQATIQCVMTAIDSMQQQNRRI